MDRVALEVDVIHEDLIEDYELGDPYGKLTQRLICVDRQVHLTHFTCWEDKPGEKSSAHDTESWSVVGPCDGTCIPAVTLPPEAEELLQRFLSSEGKDCGEVSKKTLRYPHLSSEKV